MFNFVGRVPDGPSSPEPRLFLNQAKDSTQPSSLRQNPPAQRGQDADADSDGFRSRHLKKAKKKKLPPKMENSSLDLTMKNNESDFDLIDKFLIDFDRARGVHDRVIPFGAGVSSPKEIDHHDTSMALAQEKLNPTVVGINRELREIQARVSEAMSKLDVVWGVEMEGSLSEVHAKINKRVDKMVESYEKSLRKRAFILTSLLEQPEAYIERDLTRSVAETGFLAQSLGPNVAEASPGNKKIRADEAKQKIKELHHTILTKVLAAEEVRHKLELEKGLMEQFQQLAPLLKKEGEESSSSSSEEEDIYIPSGRFHGVTATARDRQLLSARRSARGPAADDMGIGGDLLSGAYSSAEVEAMKEETARLRTELAQARKSLTHARIEAEVVRASAVESLVEKHRKELAAEKRFWEQQLQQEAALRVAGLDSLEKARAISLKRLEESFFGHMVSEDLESVLSNMVAGQEHDIMQIRSHYEEVIARMRKSAIAREAHASRSATAGLEETIKTLQKEVKSLRSTLQDASAYIKSLDQAQDGSGSPQLGRMISNSNFNSGGGGGGAGPGTLSREHSRGGLSRVASLRALISAAGTHRSNRSGDEDSSAGSRGRGFGGDSESSADDLLDGDPLQSLLPDSENFFGAGKRATVLTDMMRGRQALRKNADALNAEVIKLTKRVSDLEAELARETNLKLKALADMDEMSLKHFNSNTDAKVLGQREAIKRLNNAVNAVTAGREAPQGVVALVFTDVQDSTALWDYDGEMMEAALAIHDSLMRTKIHQHNGYEVKTEGDAFMVAFSKAVDAVAWCLDVQTTLCNHDGWPEDLAYFSKDLAPQYSASDPSVRLWGGIRVRMGVHVGQPICKIDRASKRMDYFGPMVNRSARVGGSAHGGQILISGAVHEMILAQRARLGNPHIKFLGKHKLKGLTRAEPIYEILPAQLAERSAQLKPIKTESSVADDDKDSDKDGEEGAAAPITRGGSGTIRSVGARTPLMRAAHGGVKGSPAHAEDEMEELVKTSGSMRRGGYGGGKKGAPTPSPKLDPSKRAGSMLLGAPSDEVQALSRSGGSPVLRLRSSSAASDDLVPLRTSLGAHSKSKKSDEADDDIAALKRSFGAKGARNLEVVLFPETAIGSPMRATVSRSRYGSILDVDDTLAIQEEPGVLLSLPAATSGTGDQLLSTHRSGSSHQHQPHHRARFGMDTISPRSRVSDAWTRREAQALGEELVLLSDLVRSQEALAEKARLQVMGCEKLLELMGGKEALEKSFDWLVAEVLFPGHRTVESTVMTALIASEDQDALEKIKSALKSTASPREVLMARLPKVHRGAALGSIISSAMESLSKLIVQSEDNSLQSQLFSMSSKEYRELSLFSHEIYSRIIMSRLSLSYCLGAMRSRLDAIKVSLEPLHDHDDQVKIAMTAHDLALSRIETVVTVSQGFIVDALDAQKTITDAQNALLLSVKENDDENEKMEEKRRVFLSAKESCSSMPKWFSDLDDVFFPKGNHKSSKFLSGVTEAVVGAEEQALSLFADLNMEGATLGGLQTRGVQCDLLLGEGDDPAPSHLTVLPRHHKEISFMDPLSLSGDLSRPHRHGVSLSIPGRLRHPRRPMSSPSDSHPYFPTSNPEKIEETIVSKSLLKAENSVKKQQPKMTLNEPGARTSLGPPIIHFEKNDTVNDHNHLLGFNDLGNKDIVEPQVFTPVWVKPLGGKRKSGKLLPPVKPIEK